MKANATPMSTKPADADALRSKPTNPTEGAHSPSAMSRKEMARNTRAATASGFLMLAFALIPLPFRRLRHTRLNFSNEAIIIASSMPKASSPAALVR